MALPKQSSPVYELVIPSTNKKVCYRPFLVKDEKALLIANQSKDIDVMSQTLKQIIADCILEDINVNELATFDIEYIFCKLRAKSVGEIVEIVLTCGNCSEKIESTIDISTIEVTKDETHTNKFVLFDKVGVKLKYPDYNTIKMLYQLSDEQVMEINNIISLIISCIDYIYDDDNVYYAKETRKEELQEFVENLTKEQMQKVLNFFATMPKLSKKIEYRCPHCQHDNSVVLEGLDSFF
jgi:DNA-directed RNA polymerase subunit RPC12/RpoP